MKMHTETRLSQFFHLMYRSAAHPDKGEIWRIICISLFIRSAFRRVVSYQSDVAGSNGEKSLHETISSQRVYNDNNKI